MTIFQRLYVNGDLSKTSKPRDLVTARKWLANMESQWTLHMMPNFVLEPGAFDPNNAVSVSRLSDDELVIVTTGGKTIRVVNIVKESK